MNSLMIPPPSTPSSYKPCWLKKIILYFFRRSRFMQLSYASWNSLPLLTAMIKSSSTYYCRKRVRSWFFLSNFMNSFSFFILDSNEKMKGSCFKSIQILFAPLPNKKFWRLLLTLQFTKISALNFLVLSVFLQRLLSKSTTVFSQSSSETLFLKRTSCFTCWLFTLSMSFWIFVSAFAMQLAMILCHSSFEKMFHLQNYSSSMPRSRIFRPQKNIGSWLPAKLLKILSEEMSYRTKMSLRSSKSTESSLTIPSKVRLIFSKLVFQNRSSTYLLVISFLINSKKMLVNYYKASSDRSLVYNSYKMSSSSIRPSKCWFSLTSFLMISQCSSTPSLMNSDKQQQIVSSNILACEFCFSPMDLIQWIIKPAKLDKSALPNLSFLMHKFSRMISMAKLSILFSKGLSISTKPSENWPSRALTKRCDQMLWSLAVECRCLIDRLISLAATPLGISPLRAEMY